MKRFDLIILVFEALLFYAWVVFPLALRAFGRRRERSREAVAELPRISILLSAYNEEGVIGPRIQNLLELDYPKDRWRALIGIDGCRDLSAAEAFAAAQGHKNIEILDFPVNRGKMSVLKDLVAAAEADGADILVFTDANTEFAPAALQMLCRPFADPSVGGVSGKLTFIAHPGTQTEEGVYWRFENWLKARESEIDSCLGANGAIYAVRRELFWKDIPANTITDDFVIGMKVREQGYRLLYEPSAVAYERLPGTVQDEWKRRVRIGSGNFQSLQLCRRCLSPSFGRFAWMFWSHKVLRWFSPHLICAACLLATWSYARYSGWLAAAVVAANAVIALAAWIGQRLSANRHPALRLPRGIAYFVVMQIAVFIGFVRYFQGNLEGRWERTARE